MVRKSNNSTRKVRAKKPLRNNCQLMIQAEATGQSAEVYLCRMLNQYDTQQEAAEAMGVTQGALSNYLSSLPITRLTSYRIDARTNSTKAYSQWVPLWPESLIGGMGN